MPQINDEVLSVYEAAAGMVDESLLYTQPDEIATTTSTDGDVNFGSNGASLQIPNTGSDYAQLEANSHPNHTSFVFNVVEARVDFSSIQTARFGWRVDEGDASPQIKVEPTSGAEELIGQSETKDLPAGFGQTEFYARVIGQSPHTYQGTTYPDASIFEVYTADNNEWVRVVCDGLKTSGGSSAIARHENDGDSNNTPNSFPVKALKSYYIPHPEVNL